MLVVFPPIFVADTKIISDYNFAALLNYFYGIIYHLKNVWVIYAKNNSVMVHLNF